MSYKRKTHDINLDKTLLVTLKINVSDLPTFVQFCKGRRPAQAVRDLLAANGCVTQKPTRGIPFTADNPKRIQTAEGDWCE